MNNKLEALINILKQIDEDKNPCIPFQLHAGIRTLLEGFGGAKQAINFLEKLLDADI